MTTKEAPALFKARVNLVLVPVVVRDAKGHAMGTYTKENFQLFDKGKPRKSLSSPSRKPARKAAKEAQTLDTIPPAGDGTRAARRPGALRRLPVRRHASEIRRSGPRAGRRRPQIANWRKPIARQSTPPPARTRSISPTTSISCTPPCCSSATIPSPNRRHRPVSRHQLLHGGPDRQ